MGAKEAQPERGQPWDGVVRREIDVELRVLDAEKRSVEVVASSEKLDSHGDIIRQFWDLERYGQNPCVLWNHNLFESSPYSFGGAVRPEDLFPIGHAENVRVVGKKLRAELVLGTKEYSEIAEKVFLGCQQKIIRAVSVGFRPGQVTRILNKDGSTKHFELGSAENPNELREISFVPMGSNPDAVAKSAAFERKHFDRLVFGGPEHERASNMMTPEEQKALDDAKAARIAAETNLATEQKKLEATGQELGTEKTLNAKLAKDLEESNKALAELRGTHAKSQLDALQGVKFAPAEREELDALVKDIGVERVLSLLSKRVEIAVTKDVPVDHSLKSPPPVSGAPDSASADLANEATKGL